MYSRKFYVRKKVRKSQIRMSANCHICGKKVQNIFNFAQYLDQA
jgi:hypothetical protein